MTSRVASHRCAGGVYTELSYQEPDLAPSVALNRAVTRIDKLAHQRAVKIL